MNRLRITLGLATAAALLGAMPLAARQTPAAAPSAASPAPPVGPGTVWKPPADFVKTLHAACDRFSGARFGSCFLQQMRRGGASAPALDFARRTDSQGYLAAFRDTGRVDVGYAEYPFRANENRLVFLVNGEPSMIDVDDVARIRSAKLKGNAAYAAVAKAHPRLTLFPADRFSQSLPLVVDLPGGGERFLVDYSLRDGCHACAIVGQARLAFAFGADGRFTGCTVERVGPPAR